MLRSVLIGVLTGSAYARPVASGAPRCLARTYRFPDQSATMSTSTSSDEILHEVTNGVAIATLNRPKALNALNTNMVRTLLKIYTDWDASSEVSCVVLKAAGEKAFCAGGDVKQVAQRAMAGDTQAGSDFFQTEYLLDHLIHTLRKPHVALIDGITFGGGAGVSVHGTFRVATERTLFAMPECAIGLYPDVGGSFYLPRLPGGTGLYMALSGARLKGADVKHATLATHYLPSALLPELEAAIQGLGHGASKQSIGELLDSFQARTQVPAGELAAQRRDIDAAFVGRKSVEEVYAALEQHANQTWARGVLDLICKGSPTSQKVTFEQLRRGAALPNLAQCLSMENRMVHNVLLNPRSDFVEGVRAMLIDRCNKPQWNPATLAEVTDEYVHSFFERPAGIPDLNLPTHGSAKL
ncbi:HIBCH1 [Auxenochlorella protothecoides x Auxenochlorella symbiontica]